MKRVAADADLPFPWLFVPAKRSDDRADYCLDKSSPTSCFKGTYEKFRQRVNLYRKEIHIQPMKDSQRGFGISP